MKGNLKFYAMSKYLYSGNVRYLAGFIILITINSVLLAIIDPIILQIVFDGLERGESKEIFFICLQAGIVTAFLFILCYIQNCYCDIWLYRLIGNGNSNSFIKYHTLPYGEKKIKYEEGDSFNRINTGVESLAYVWLFLSLIVSAFLCCIIISSYALTISPWIIILGVILFLFTIARAGYENKKNMAFSVWQQKSEGIREGDIHNLIHNMEFMVMTGTVDILRNRYIDARNSIWEVERKRTYLSVWLDAIEETVRGIFRGLLAFLIFPLKNANIIRTGQVVASFSIYDSLYNNLCYLRRPIINLPQKFVPVERLNQMLNLHRENSGEISEIEKLSVINISNVNFKQGTKEILKNISLEIYKGQKVAIVGHNGCGKSTLLRIILGLYAPGEGYSTVMGYNSAYLTYAMRRSLISFIPSRNQLFTQSSLWNIETGSEDEDIENVINLAKVLMADQKEDSFLYKNVNELSGGQAQRINIARALIQKAPIILADEPAASLDSQMGELVVQQIISSGETVIMVTHQPSHIRFFDRLIIMDDGLIVADGSINELQNSIHYKKWLAKHDGNVLL